MYAVRTKYQTIAWFKSEGTRMKSETAITYGRTNPRVWHQCAMIGSIPPKSIIPRRIIENQRI